MFVFNDFPYLFSNYDRKFERHTGRGAGILLVPLCSAAVEAFLSSNFVQSLLKILLLICFSFQDGTEPWTLKTFPKIYNSKELVFSFLNYIVTYCWFFSTKMYKTSTTFTQVFGNSFIVALVYKVECRINRRFAGKNFSFDYFWGPISFFIEVNINVNALKLYYQNLISNLKTCSKKCKLICFSASSVNDCLRLTLKSDKNR